ncbi:MAG: type II secretion system protein [Planctomycetota bacterium]
MHRPRVHARERAHGFTLVELLATIAVIFLVMGIAVVAYSAATRSAQSAAERSAVSGLKLAVEQFEREFGFLPPLIADDGGDPANPQPPLAAFNRGTDGRVIYVPRLLSPGVPGDAEVLRGKDEDRARYSELSFAYYLIGGLSEEVDGVDGPGFVEVRPDGRFAPTQAYVDADGNAVQASARGPERFEPLFDLTRGGVELLVDPESDLDVPVVVQLRNSGGQAFRYYRWLPDTDDYATEVAADPDMFTDEDFGYGYLGDDSVTVSGLVAYFNVPSIVLDAIAPIDTDGNRSITAADTAADAYTLPLSLRNARYAIVSPGPNQLFGDETPDELAADDSLRRRYAERLGLSEARLASDADARVEALVEARADNIVEVGS